MNFVGSPQLAAKNELKTAQVRILPKSIIAEGTAGAIVWMTPTRAKLMIDHGAVELVNGSRQLIGPAEMQALTGSLEKKTESSEEILDGPSIDSLTSSPPGEAEQSLSQAEDLPLRNRNVSAQAKRGRRGK